MNPSKWKSVVINLSAYRKLKSLAVKNHRTISGQFTHILEEYEKGTREDNEKRAVNQ